MNWLNYGRQEMPHSATFTRLSEQEANNLLADVTEEYLQSTGAKT